MYIDEKLAGWLNIVVTEVFTNSDLHGLTFAPQILERAEVLLKDAQSPLTATDHCVCEVLRCINNSGVTPEITDFQRALIAERNVLSERRSNKGFSTDAIPVKQIQDALLKAKAAASFGNIQPQELDIRFAHSRAEFVARFKATSSSMTIAFMIWGRFRLNAIIQVNCTFFQHDKAVGDLSLLGLSLIPSLRVYQNADQLDQPKLEEDFVQMFRLVNLLRNVET